MIFRRKSNPIGTTIETIDRRRVVPRSGGSKYKRSKYIPTVLLYLYYYIILLSVSLEPSLTIIIIIIYHTVSTGVALTDVARSLFSRAIDLYVQGIITAVRERGIKSDIIYCF